MPLKSSKLQSRKRACVCVFTDGAVFSVPALFTLALAIPAGPMFHTLWVTQSLVTVCTCPALLTVANAPDTHTVTTTIC